MKTRIKELFTRKKYDAPLWAVALIWMGVSFHLTMAMAHAPWWESLSLFLTLLAVHILGALSGRAPSMRLADKYLQQRDMVMEASGQMLGKIFSVVPPGVMEEIFNCDCDDCVAIRSSLKIDGPTNTTLQ